MDHMRSPHTKTAPNHRLAVPRDLEDITPSWLTSALRHGQSLGTAWVISCSAEIIAEGTGFMNRLYRLTVRYSSNADGLPSTMIVKLPSVDPQLGTVFDKLGQNRREVRFYRSLASNQHLPGPRCYFSEVDPTTGNTVLLLEDMAHARQGDSVSGCSMDDARRAITQLARFQASWWDTPALDDLDWMPLKDEGTDAYLDIYPHAWESLKHKAGIGLPDRLRRIGESLKSSVPSIKSALSRHPRTIVHGDYRLDNCFFDDSSRSTPPTVFDWEFCVRGRGVCDVATFVSEAFPPEQRRRVESRLVHTYHSVLVENGATEYSFDDCWRDYRLAMLETFVFWIVSGGHCNYDGSRATTYLHNAMARLDAAINDLASTELLAGCTRVR